MGWIKRLLVRRVEYGHICPWGWGQFSHDWASRACLVAPIPLNLVFGIVRYLYFACVIGVPKHPNESAFRRLDRGE
jgi:hypothetical protein